MSNYRAAIIGCGSRAPAHIESYKHIPGAGVAACCAPSGKRRDPLAARYGLRAYDDPKEMIAKEKPDIVHIVTWPDVRVPLMTLVSDVGVPLCTVEKPVAVGVADWRKLIELEAVTKTRFAVCHQFRWHPHVIKCREALDSGQLGKVRFLDISSGMNITGQGTHTLNYGMFLIGDSRVRQVFGNASGWDGSDTGHPAPSSTEAYLVFENGVRGLWTSGPVSPRSGDPSTTWQHVRISAYADNGLVNYEEFGRFEIRSSAGVESGAFDGLDEWSKNNELAQAGFHRAMFDWLEDETKVPGTDLGQSLHEWAVVLALYQSALTGEPVEMSSFDPDDDLVDQLRRKLERS